MPLEKERLTREIIREELKRQGIHDTLRMIIPAVVLLVSLCFLTYSYLQDDSALDTLTAIFWGALLLIFLYVFGAVALDSIKEYRELKRDRFSVITDRLVGVENKREHGPGTMGILFNRPYTLYFASYGPYCIRRGQSYKWSEKYRMTDKGSYTYSNIGDEFYLVTMNGKKILIIYNTKLFALEEDNKK